MKFKLLAFFIILSSCSNNYTKFENKKPYNATGFAYIYNHLDFDKKIVKNKFESNELQISHKDLKAGTLIRLLNPKTGDSLVLKNLKKTDYPDFYKILITKKVADKLNIDYQLPIIELIELKKNKSFVAKKAKIFNEEKKISSNAPVASVEISNISKNKKSIKKSNDQMYILIASFYSKDSAVLLKNRITEEILTFDSQKIKIMKRKMQKIDLLSGPYNTVNLLKNDYILLKNFGFEELNIIINE